VIILNIFISDEASQWFEDELGLKKGDHVRFYVRYGGCGSIQSGFSLGISKDQPDQIGASLLKNDILYYVEEKDIWYFDSHDLEVTYNKKQDEVEFHYKK
jgi:uncharacterized protein YneR